MDNDLNLLGYAAGFGIGNILGITLEQKVALGYVQINIISRHFADKIPTILRKQDFGVTLLPAEGGSGGMAVIVVILKRKEQNGVIN